MAETTAKTKILEVAFWEKTAASTGATYLTGAIEFKNTEDIVIPAGTKIYLTAFYQHAEGNKPIIKGFAEEK